MMPLYPRRCLRQLKPTFFTLICIGALILLRNLAYDNSVYQSISLHQKMEYQIFSSFYQKDEGVRRVFRKKVAHLDELGLSNIQDNIPVQDDIVCRHPKLDLSNDANKAAFYDVGSVQCFGRELFTFEKGVLRFNRSSVRGDVIKRCSYQAVERIDDNYATYTTPLTRNSTPFDMVLQHDFIRVQCYFEIEENTNNQRSLLSVKSRHGKHLLSIPERHAAKVSSLNGVQHGESKNGISQPIPESETIRTGKKMALRSKRSPLAKPLVPNKHSQESGLKYANHHDLVKSGSIQSSPNVGKVKSLNRINIIKPPNLAGKNSLNTLQRHESSSMEKTLQIMKEIKSLETPKKETPNKESEHPPLAIANPLPIQKRQPLISNQRKSPNHDKAEKGISNSNPNFRIMKETNKSIKFPKPPIFGENQHSAKVGTKKSFKKLFPNQDKSAKSNMQNTRIQANKSKLYNLYPISSSNINVGHRGQQANSSLLVRKMIKSPLVKKSGKKEEIVQLSSALSKQKNVLNKSSKQRTNLLSSNINHFKKNNLKEIHKSVGSRNVNYAIPALTNVGSEKVKSQRNKDGKVIFRELNYPELNRKQGPYAFRKKELRIPNDGRFEAVYLKPKSQISKSNRKVNSSLWRSGIGPSFRAKPIRKYFKKIPTHLAQLPESKQQKSNPSVNKSTNSSSKISNTKQSHVKIQVASQVIPMPKVIPSLNPSISLGTSHLENNPQDMLKTSIAKSETKVDHSNNIPQVHEVQVPPLPQTDDKFDVFAVKSKPPEGKKNINGSDSFSYDSYKEMYINLPPEDYGISEELPDIEQFFVQIYPKPEVFQRISEVPPFVRINVIPLNILIYGLDSLSHLSFQRKLPLSYKHLKDSLNAVIMNGYNIVGDATTAAIIPLLTGRTETELPEVRKNQLASGFVDDYPLIWNKYRSKGYATLFAEDSPSLAVFNLRFNGFYAAPTDHYMRPFWQAVSESVLHERSLNFCLGSKPKHQFTLDYVMDFFQKYDNVSKFAFAFHGELSHNDNNPVQYLDKDFLRFLKQMEQRNFLNNTLLIVMSDHGARYSNVRNTVQGKLEERLPFMSFVFPPWFHKKYPYFMKNLEGNREKLVTPFDVHETMLDMLDTSRMYEPVDYSTRGISLLQSVPLNRTCRSAGIAMHWCSCLTRFDVNPSTPLVQMSLHKILSYIRTLLLPVKHLCAELSLKKVIYAYLVSPNEKVLKFTNSKDADNRVANFSQQTLLDTVHYQLTFETYPNSGLYEASVQVDIRKESFQVFPEISRLNKYGEQPSCIKETFPDLRKYCYCKIR